METRICNKCQKSKTMDRFGLRKDLGYKPLRICKDCINEASSIRKRKAKNQVVFVPKKDPNVLLPPYRPPFAEREVYIPPKWGR